MDNKNKPQNPNQEARKAPGQDFPGKPADIYAQGKQQQQANPGQPQHQGGQPKAGGQARPAESFEQEPQRSRDPSIAGKPQHGQGPAKPGQGNAPAEGREFAKEGAKR